MTEVIVLERERLKLDRLFLDIASERNIKQLIMDFRFASFSKFAKSNLFAAQDFKHFEPEVLLHEAEARNVATSEVKLLHSLCLMHVIFSCRRIPTVQQSHVF